MSDHPEAAETIDEEPRRFEALKFMRDLKRGRFSTRLDAARKIVRDLGPALLDEEQVEAFTLIAQIEGDKTAYDHAAFLDLIPDGWFKRYFHARQASEAPILFHFCCALAVLSHKLNRTVDFWLDGYSLYPPTSVFIVGPAGLSQKSSAIEPARRIARMADTRIIKDIVSPEGLMRELGKNNDALLVATEAGTMLTTREYQSDLPKLLLVLFDMPDEPIEKTLAKGTFRIPAMSCVSGLFATAPAAFRSMPREVIGGGFLSRMLVVFEQGSEKTIPFPEDVMRRKHVEKLDAELAEELIELADRKYEPLRYRGAAKRTYDAFYADVKRAGRDAGEKVSNWFGRKAAHLHRIVMNLQASMGKGMSPTVDTLNRAVAIVETIEERMQFAYKHAAQGLYEGKRQSILDALDRAGGSKDYSSLLRGVGGRFRDTNEFKDQLELLVENNLIRTRKVKGRGARAKVMIELLRRG